MQIAPGISPSPRPSPARERRNRRQGGKGGTEHSPISHLSRSGGGTLGPAEQEKGGAGVSPDLSSLPPGRGGATRRRSFAMVTTGTHTQQVYWEDVKEGQEIPAL